MKTISEREVFKANNAVERASDHVRREGCNDSPPDDRDTIIVSTSDGAAGELLVDEGVLPPPLPPREVRLVCPPGLDKAARTLLHGVFRSHMPYLSTRAIVPTANVVGSANAEGEIGTVRRGTRGGVMTGGSMIPAIDKFGGDTVTYLEVCHEGRSDGRRSWPSERGEYLEFTVYKAGRSTQEAAEALCRRLRIQRGRYVHAYKPSFAEGVRNNISRFFVVVKLLQVLTCCNLDAYVGAVR